MIFKVRILFLIVSSLLFAIPSAAADFTYQEYTKAPEVWKRGFVFGISQYMSAVAQPDEEAPYPVRTAFQRCLASSTDTLLVRQVEAYVAANQSSGWQDRRRSVALPQLDSEHLPHFLWPQRLTLSNLPLTALRAHWGISRSV